MSKKRKPLYMESTAIAPERTAAEISAVLIAAGARQIATDYGEDRKLKGLRWTMFVRSRELLFAMPARVDPVYQILRKRMPQTAQTRVREQAERVAWRQLLRWIQAQQAMIDTGMVDASEVFFPYLQLAPGRTAYELFAANEFKQLSAPQASE